MNRITVLLGLVFFATLFSCKKDEIVPTEPISTKTTNKTIDSTASAASGKTPAVDTAKSGAVSGQGTAQVTPKSPTPATPSTGTTTQTGTGTTTTKPATGTTIPATPATGTTTKTGTGTTTTKPATGATTIPTTPSTPSTPPTVQAQALAGVYGDGIHDDTRALQQLLNAGNVTLLTGKTFNVTGLVVSHALNLNGATIAMTGTRSYTISLAASGASITNGSIVGQWNNSMAGNPNGAAGIGISADNVSISYVSVSSFPGYGIASGAFNNPSITYCTIQNTGYIGFYYDPETKSTTGGTFSHNAVDRSMVPASTVNEACAEIRGSVANDAILTSGWTISSNSFKMPSKPAKLVAECMEVRHMTNSVISNNVFTAGTIGCSVVACSGVTVTANQFSGSSQEAIEFADAKSCATQNNTITSSPGAGILINGGTGSNGITISGDNISGTAGDCIHAYFNTQNLVISGCMLTAGQNKNMVNFQGTSAVKIQNTKFNGNGTANAAVIVDTCPGNIAIIGGTVSNLKSFVVTIYSAKAGLVTDNVTMAGTTISGVPKALNVVLQNGASVGANIAVKL